MTAGILLAACVLDVIVGDPPRFPHPVRLMGRAIAKVEALVEPAKRRPVVARLSGMLLGVGLPAVVFGAAWTVIDLAGQVHTTLGIVSEVILAATTLAARDLSDHALAVRKALDSSLESARAMLSRIVGRDTATLTEPEVVRAAVETIAESTCDGVIAPLFYLALGGAPLAMAYKAINTLDSMIGHRTTEHLYFGWASARLDDVANWIPARITAGLLILAGAIGCGAPRRAPEAFQILIRDGWKHPSPNSGRPEAAMAGLLQVQLGGVNFYEGLPELRPYLGDPVRKLGREDITVAVRVMWTAYVLALVPVAVILLL